MATFNVNATGKMTGDTLSAWMLLRMTGDLQEVPYVGPKTAAALEAAGVATSFQLCAKFLEGKGPGVTSQALCDAFYAWLKSAGVNSHRGAITLCIAEKVALAFPAAFSRDELAGTGEAGEDDA